MKTIEFVGGPMDGKIATYENMPAYRICFPILNAGAVYEEENPWQDWMTPNAPLVTYRNACYRQGEERDGKVLYHYEDTR